MIKRIGLDDVDFTNKDFWMCFFCSSFPNAFDNNEEISLSELIMSKGLSNLSWWDEFTGYYEGILDETDGYLEEPTSLVFSLNDKEHFKIEFHPGDTLFYFNDEEIASTGPHAQLQVLSYSKIESYLKQVHGVKIFFLLLPLAKIEDGECLIAKERIQALLLENFQLEDSEQLAEWIVNGLK